MLHIVPPAPDRWISENDMAQENLELMHEHTESASYFKKEAQTRKMTSEEANSARTLSTYFSIYVFTHTRVQALMSFRPASRFGSLRNNHKSPQNTKTATQ